MENPIADQARALATQGAYDQAVHLLRQALLTQPNDLSVRFALGELLYRAHLFQEAVPHLEACRDHPDYIKAWLYCSNIFGVQKHFRQSFYCLYQYFGEKPTTRPLTTNDMTRPGLFGGGPLITATAASAYPTAPKHRNCFPTSQEISWRQ